MREYLTLGPTPTDEPCAQVGSENYHDLSKMELYVYKNQLLRLFKPKKVSIASKSFAHDFGTYSEICVFYNDEDEDEAMEIENNLPTNWDLTAAKELTTLGYFKLLPKKDTEE